MPDIAMCNNTECPLATTCKRSPSSGTVANPYRQSYSSWQPTFVGLSDHEPSHPGWVCDGYWPTVSITNDK